MKPSAFQPLPGPIYVRRVFNEEPVIDDASYEHTGKLYVCLSVLEVFSTPTRQYFTDS